jgi:5-methylcytosine-specific restriction endonuclease McrA
MSTTLERLDQEFSLMVRTRANWKCARCGGDFSGNRDALHCSHFHSRRHKATRFDPENATALCFSCHWYLDHHPNVHRIWKLTQIGEERYEALAKRANTIAKLDLKTILECVRAETRMAT